MLVESDSLKETHVVVVPSRDPTSVAVKGQILGNPSQNPAVQPPSHFRVLVVDDLLMNLKVVDRMLKWIGVGKSKTVTSGQLALEELRGAEDNAPGLSQLVEVEALFDLGVGAENVGKG